MVKGEKMLAAMVRLEAGCKVPLHHHESEQMAYIISGRVRWGLGDPDTPERQEFEACGGSIVHLPSNLPHEVEALEETMILDMLAPPGPMGVDSHKQ
jgi:quercetin dioxygenase-like cupin family protein